MHIALCTYRVKRGSETAFLDQLRKHQPTLLRHGLVTDEHHAMYRGKDDQDRSFFVEILSWHSVDGPMLAEQVPEIIRIWEAMGQLCESRAGQPPMEFPFVDLLTSS